MIITVDPVNKKILLTFNIKEFLSNLINLPL